MVRFGQQEPFPPREPSVRKGSKADIDLTGENRIILAGSAWLGVSEILKFRNVGLGPFLRISCDRCGKDRMLNESHAPDRQRESALDQHSSLIAVVELSLQAALGSKPKGGLDQTIHLRC
jgi:hypothetical protein